MRDRRPNAAFAPAGRVRSIAYRSLSLGMTMFNKAASVTAHAAAGLLKQNDLRIASQALWADFATESEHVDAGFEVWERRMYERLLRPSDRVLLIGCGTGRDLVALRELGHEVTGLDPATDIVERAEAHLRRRGLTARVLSGFIQDTELCDCYDVAVFSGRCYSFIQGSAIRIATLAKVGARLSSGGRIAIPYSPRHDRSPVAVWVTMLSARLMGADWRPERGDTFGRAYFGSGVLTYEHLFAPDEVSEECRQAGLVVASDDNTHSTPWVVAVRP